MPIYRMHCPHCGAECDIYRTVVGRNEDLPLHCSVEMMRKVCAPAVIGDIQPYQAMGVDVATGKAPIISSRGEHRAYLRRNGYVEVGNEKPKTAGRELQGDFNVREELAQAVREVVPKYTV